MLATQAAPATPAARVIQSAKYPGWMISEVIPGKRWTMTRATRPETIVVIRGRNPKHFIVEAYETEELRPTQRIGRFDDVNDAIGFIG